MSPHIFKLYDFFLLGELLRNKSALHYIQNEERLGY